MMNPLPLINEDDFEQYKRDPLLTYVCYVDMLNFHQKDRTDIYQLINDTAKERSHRAGNSWSVTSKKFEYAMLVYSSGYDINICETLMSEALAELEQYKQQFSDEIFLQWEIDSIQFLLQAFSFAVLSGNTKILKTIVRFIGQEPNELDEPIFSILTTRLSYTGLSRDNAPYYPKTYQSLFDAMNDVTPQTKEVRQAYVKQYLKTWYKGMKDCYFYDLHKNKGLLFFGYWAFEAAMVTVLYDLDDSDYSHMLYYPKDLVAYARLQGYDQRFSEYELANQQHYIALPNTPAPIAGEWLCNLTDEVVCLKQGELLPSEFANENNHKLFWVL